MRDVPIFDRFAPLYDYVMPTADAAPIEEAFALASGDVERVLDLAGGTGRVARSLKKETVVSDASRGMLARATADSLVAVQGDARTLPLRADAFDAITLVDALHHLPQPDRVLRECRRVLRPGGILVVRDFDPTTIRGRFLVSAERAFGFDAAFSTPADVATRLDAASLYPRVIDAGFAYTVVGRAPDGKP